MAKRCPGMPAAFRIRPARHGRQNPHIYSIPPQFADDGSSTVTDRKPNADLARLHLQEQVCAGRFAPYALEPAPRKRARLRHENHEVWRAPGFRFRAGVPRSPASRLGEASFRDALEIRKDTLSTNSIHSDAIPDRLRKHLCRYRLEPILSIRPSPAPGPHRPTIVVRALRLSFHIATHRRLWLTTPPVPLAVGALRPLPLQTGHNAVQSLRHISMVKLSPLPACCPDRSA